MKTKHNPFARCPICMGIVPENDAVAICPLCAGRVVAETDGWLELVDNTDRQEIATLAEKAAAKARHLDTLGCEHGAALRAYYAARNADKKTPSTASAEAVAKTQVTADFISRRMDAAGEVLKGIFARRDVLAVRNGLTVCPRCDGRGWPLKCTGTRGLAQNPAKKCPVCAGLGWLEPS